MGTMYLSVSDFNAERLDEVFPLHMFFSENENVLAILDEHNRKLEQLQKNEDCNDLSYRKLIRSLNCDNDDNEVFNTRNLNQRVIGERITLLELSGRYKREIDWVSFRVSVSVSINPIFKLTFIVVQF